MPLLLAVAVAACIPATGAPAQRITVEASSARSTTAIVRLWRRDGGCWDQVAGPWRAHVGRNGVSTHHREGDGTTPAGSFAIGPTMYGNGENPGVRYRYHRLACGDWWDEDPASPTYNTFRHAPCGAAPPFGGGDPLWRSPRAYSQFAVIAFNAHPAVPGLGSAIFVHADVGKPTSGCVSLPRAQLVRLLRWLRPELSPIVSIGTRSP